MNNNKPAYRNIILISQVSINIMVPIFMCLFIGLWIDNKFSIGSVIPLLILGILAGGRNAYVLVMNTIRREEEERKKTLEEDINSKLKKANEQQNKDGNNEKN